MARKSRVDSQLVQVGDIGAVYGGTKVDGAVKIQDALQLANLDWNVGIRELRMADKNRTPVPGYYATYRDDTNTPLGVVKSRYTPVQNRDAFSWLQDVIGTDGACVTSAGALHDGRYTWVCVDLGGFDVLPGDEIRKHMLVLNSHDGSHNLLVQLLPHRIACQNILNFSFGVNGGSEPFKVRHTDTVMVKLSEVQQVIAIANHSFGDVQETFTQFKDTPVDKEGQDSIIYRFLEVSDDERKEFYSDEFKDRCPQWVNHHAMISDVIARGPGHDLPGVRDTVWGVFNGMNSYYDHIRIVRGAGVNPDNAIESKLMGHSAKMKTRAFEACLEAVSKN